MHSDLPLGPPIVRINSLADKAEAALRQALMSGSLAPGQNVTVRALSQQLGVSVTPAKEAMTRLIAEGVMEWGPRRTATVPLLTAPRIREIYIIRIALESAAAGAAVPHFREPHFKALARINERLTSAYERGDYKAVLIANRDFHFQIYELAKLPFLFSLIEGQWLRMGPSLNLLYSRFMPRDWENRPGRGFHSEIIAALRDRDAAAVSQCIAADLAGGRVALEAALTASPLSKAT